MTSFTEPAATPAALEAVLPGRVPTAGTPEWHEEIAAFNSATVHAPELVVAATCPEDVQAAVRHAAATGLPVAVQATGHGAGAAIEGGVLVSTGAMDQVVIDPERRTATVGAGAKWRAVIDAAAEHGLAPLSGSTSDVGAVGYTVGGGLPLMGRTFGFAADHVVSFELVTADGQLRHVDAQTEPDLFWALRGGKGNVGIVTSMTVELVEVRTVFGGGVFYAAEHIPAVLHAFRQWTADLPDTACSSVAVLRLPPMPDIPEPLRGQTLAHVRFCYLGDPSDGERLLAPMREVAPALVDTVAEMPYTASDSIHMDPDHALSFYERGILLRELAAETVDALLAVVGPQERSPILLCELRHLGGALCRPPVVANAVSGRDAAYSLFAVAVLAPEIAAVAPGAVEAAVAAAAPWGTGRTMLNLHGAPGDEADRARGWDDETYRRLCELVGRYDPAGMFRFGHAVGRPTLPRQGQR